MTPSKATYLTVFLATEKMCIEWIWIGHKCHFSCKQSFCLSLSTSHVFCWEVTIHDECLDELFATAEFIMRSVPWSELILCISCLSIIRPGWGMLDRTLPLIHPWDVHHHDVQAHYSFDSAYHTIDKKPWGVAYIDSTEGNQYIKDWALPWKGMWTYCDTSREHAIGYALKLWIVLLGCGLTLQVISQEVIQHWEGEGSFNLLVAWRKHPKLNQLFIPRCSHNG